MLSKRFDIDELTTIWQADETEVPSELRARYKTDLKLFGEKTLSWEEWARATRFAKWADDNWAEATDPYDESIDFGKVTNPIKEWPSMYEVDATESYWVKEYRYGSTSVPGYGIENAEERAHDAWWEYDVDMEYGDSGDTDDHELEIDDVRYEKSLKEARIKRLLREHDTPKKELNPEVQEGDVIKLVYMDDPWSNIVPGTLGVVTGRDSYQADKILVNWMVNKDKISHLPLLSNEDVYMLSNRDELDDETKRIFNLREQTEEERNDGEDTIYYEPFTPLEIRILKTLHKYLDRSELQQLSTETPEEYRASSKKFWNVMKMFGITPTDTENNTRTSKYAKWALDNWTEEGDYDNIENPIKVPLKWYQVDREESGSQIEYKDGTTEVLGFDEDDAAERGDYNFWDWGGEMETNDYGDYESYDSEVVNTEFLRMDEGLAEGRSLNKWKQKLLEQKQNKKIDEWLDEKPMTLNEAQENGGNRRRLGKVN